MKSFTGILNTLPVFDLIKQVSAQLGIKTYVIGGFVRDLLLERPSKDIDIVCLGDAILFAKAIAQQINQQDAQSFTSVNYFKNFGTAMLQYQDWEVEFVGARKESYNRNSRKPVVESGTLEDDQNRRDFTINAMAISLNEWDYGTLLDPFDGVTDLKLKRIQTPLDPDITFSDDPLRMMRAIRFAAQLSQPPKSYFDIVPKTFEAIKINTDRINIVSQERITDELNKIILSNQPSYGFKLLYHGGLLDYIFPEMVALQGVDIIDGKAHKDNFFHTLQVLDNVAEVSDDLWVRWAAILHDIAKPITKRFDKQVGWTFHGHEEKGARMVYDIFRKLKLPLDQKMKFVQKLVRLHLRPIALVKDVITDSAIRRLLYEAGDSSDALMILCRADITSKNQDKVHKYLKNFDKVEKRMREVEEKDKLRNFQPAVSGTDIMEELGLPPSQAVGEIKSAIREAILEGTIRNTKEEGFQLMWQLAKEKGLVDINGSLRPVNEKKSTD